MTSDTDKKAITIDFLAETTGLSKSIIKKELNISGNSLSEEELREKMKNLATSIFES